MIRSLFAAGLVLTLLALAPVQTEAQHTALFGQEYDPDPFPVLLEHDLSWRAYLDVGAGSNFLGVGDAVAVGYLVDDFRFSDVFLVAGLVPGGRGAHMGTENRSGVTLSIPLPAGLTVGLRGGVRAIGRAEIPDGLPALLRDGSAGDTLRLDASDLAAEGIGYAEAAFHVAGSHTLERGLSGYPFSVLYGGGVKYVRPLAYGRLGLAGDQGDGESYLEVSSRGVTAELNLVAPVMDEMRLAVGAGLAFDVMAGARLGDRMEIRAALTDLGAMEIDLGPREVIRLQVEDLGIEDVGTVSDSTVTDTLPGLTRSIQLPAMLRITGAFRPFGRLRTGVAVAVPLSSGMTMEPLARAVLEFRPLVVLPLRAGVSWGPDFGFGTFGGLAIDARYFRWDLGVRTDGGPVLAEIRGVGVRTGLTFRF